jgi:hypothetical protein
MKVTADIGKPSVSLFEARGKKKCMCLVWKRQKEMHVPALSLEKSLLQSSD